MAEYVWLYSRGGGGDLEFQIVDKASYLNVGLKNILNKNLWPIILFSGKSIANIF